MLVKPVSLLGNLLLLGVLGLILATQYPTLSAFRLRGWIGMLLLLAATLITGWFLGGPAQVTRPLLPWPRAFATPQSGWSSSRRASRARRQ